MKKIFSALVLLTLCGIFNFCSAYTPYDGNPDYIYIGTYGSGGFSKYLYTPSVDVQEYNPPHYQIAGNFVTYGGREIKSESWDIFIVRYNWYTKETFERDDRGIWIKENINNVFGSYYRKRADALFRAAYGINFYGY